MKSRERGSGGGVDSIAVIGVSFQVIGSARGQRCRNGPVSLEMCLPFFEKKNKKQKTKRQLLSGECRLVKLAQYLPEEAEVNKAGRRMERGSQELLSIGQVVIILLAMFPHSKQRKRLIGHVSCPLVMLELLIGQTCFHPTFCAFIMIQKKKVPQLSVQTIFRDFFFFFKFCCFVTFSNATFFKMQ